MDVNYVMLIIMSVVFSLGYGIAGYIKAAIETGEPWKTAKFAATAIYSIIIGILMVYFGIITPDTIANFTALVPAVWATYIILYTFLLYFFEKILLPVVSTLLTKTTIYRAVTTVDPNRKMDAETRGKFFNDQPDIIKNGILKAVDQAEAKPTWRYAIRAGAWEYLVEFGEVTGGKHYWYKGWFGSSVVDWKPISSECLETIRKTGKWPDYDKLY